MNFKIKELSVETIDDWRNVCSFADDAWYWHTLNWIELVTGEKRKHSIDHSVIVYYDDIVVALIPLVIYSIDEKNIFSYGGWSLPFPVILFDKVPVKKKDKIVDFVFSYIDSVALKNRVVVGKYFINSTNYEEPCCFTKLLPRGYLINYDSTTVVPLENLSFDEIFMQSRSKYRQLYRKAKKIAKCEIYDKNNMTIELSSKWRSIEQFYKNQSDTELANLLYSIAYDGDGFFILSRDLTSNKIVASLFVITFKKNAYDFNALVHPDYKRDNLSILMKFCAIEYLCKNSYKKYDLGIYNNVPMLHRIPDEKKIGITNFKEGFMNIIEPLILVEKYYNKEVFIEVQEKRMKEYEKAIF